MATTTASRLADLDFDAEAIRRWARDLEVPDVAEIARSADVPARIDAGLSAASAAVRGALEHLPSERRRRRRRSFLLGGLVVTLLTFAGVAATWWMRRMTVVHAAEDAELAFDAEALDRAADDGAGMAIAPDLTAAGEPLTGAARA
jgi:hypothetical protein